MTKRERAIIMAYTGGVTFKGDDIQYFLEYVKEKTGMELNVAGWYSWGDPIMDFGPNEKETIKKIQKACKKDYNELIKRSNEEENKKIERDKNSKLFFKKLKALQQLLGRDLRPDEVLLLGMFESLEIVKGDEGKENAVLAGTSAKVSISLKTCVNASDRRKCIEDEDTEVFGKKTLALRKFLGRDLKPDEVLLLGMYDSLEIKKGDMKKEDGMIEIKLEEEKMSENKTCQDFCNDEESSKDAEDNTFHINGRCNGKDLFFKKIAALEQRCFKRKLRPDETLLLMLFDTTKVDKTDKDDENLIFNKKVTELEKRFGRELRPSEALLLVLFNSLEVVKADDKKEDVKCDEKEDMSKAGNWLLTLVLLAAALGIDPESGSKKESEWTKVKEFRKHMDECCCAKKEDEK